jgi:hypothetical protein
MYRKAVLIFAMTTIIFSVANAQLDPGGIGGDGGGGDVSDVDGGSGNTGGNQGTTVPIDGGIYILVAAGAVVLGRKLHKIILPSLN